ncbi:uncharacterized protein LOC122861158 [Aphidius gifuensis]|uniref:uncharacterized protein LOC122861158 n=1 Tax=Aphidius gifuensis TaxID=684658 RepID=UPI001CDC1FAA|nr:uncharacterized protein LOC122861158 [Aphidius gifuensis]
MSGILRHTLRLGGTAKYALNNSTKYLRSMTLSTNRLTHSSPVNYWTTIQTAGKEILSIFGDEEVKISDIGCFKVSLTSGKVGLITPKFFFGKKDLILPATFNTELNGEPIEPESNKIADEQAQTSFTLDKWDVSLDGGKLTFKLKDSDEIFILKHSMYAKALQKPPKVSETGGVIQTLPTLSSDITNYPAKIISKSEQLGLLERPFPPVNSYMPVERLEHFGSDVTKSLIKCSNGKITDAPDEFGKMKLFFPMTVLLEGGRQEITTTNSLNTLTVHHEVEIETKKVLSENLKNEFAVKKVDERSNIGLLEILLDSGDLIIELTHPNNQSIIMRQEVVIVIDLDGKHSNQNSSQDTSEMVQSISIGPVIKVLENY